MFRVVNDNIYIGKGETPTYQVRLVFADGSPFRLSDEVVTADMVFAVSSSPYMDRNVLFRYELSLTEGDGAMHRFADMGLAERPVGDQPPLSGNEGKLHFSEMNGVVDYSYYDYTDAVWVPYEAVLAFPLMYEDTSRLAVKTYWYDLNMFYYNTDDTVTYKEQLIRPHWFVVEGSMSYGI